MHLIFRIDLSAPKLSDIQEYLEQLRTLKDSLKMSEPLSKHEDSKTPEMQSQMFKYKYQEALEVSESSKLEEVRAIVSKLASFKKQFNISNDLWDKKKSVKSEKSNQLSALRNKLKSLMNNSNTCMVQRTEELDQSFDALDDLMQKKKSTQSALFRIEVEITNTNLANTYLKVEGDFKELGSNVTQAQEQELGMRKQHILQLAEQRYEILTSSTKRITDQSKKISSQLSEIEKDPKFVVSTEYLSNYRLMTL